MRVLLVEDNPQVRGVIREVLEDVAGTSVVYAAESQREACAWLATHPDAWDLAVVDLFLQDGHGFNVLRACRDRLPHQRAVVLSNYNVAHVREYVRDAGADAFFDKSWDIEALVAFCRDLAAPGPSAGGSTPARCVPCAGTPGC